MLEEARYADSGALFAECLEEFLPAAQQSVAEYAAEHRYLQNEGGGYVGRWDHAMVPYLVEPMECLTSLDFLSVAVAGPGQSAKTSIAENMMLRSVGIDPASMLWYMQTDQALAAYVKERITPMIDGHAVLREKLGLQAIDDSLHYKRFRGMSVQFLAATYSNLISKAAPRIVVDEIDAFPKSLGDVKAMVDIRRQTYGNESMALFLSHPDRARGLDPAEWTDGIMSIFADSDRRVWYWPCPHCGAYSSPAPIATRFMSLEYDARAPLEEITEAAYLRCPVSGCIVVDKERRAMNRAARWIGLGQEIDEDGKVTGDLLKRATAGFWIVGAMSPFILGGIGGLARNRVKAERDLELTGEDQTLRGVMAKEWGFPYTKPKSVGSIDANTLAERARSETALTLGMVAEGVRCLMVSVDCQAAHFEWLVRGFGVNAESWVIAHGRLPANPAASVEDWDTLLETVLTKAWPLADLSGRVMRPRGAGFDLSGTPGTTAQAYAAWRRWRKRSQSPIRCYGTVGGREAWSILPLQGAPGPNAPRLQIVYPDTQRKAARFARGEVPVARFAPNRHKDDLAGHLVVAEPAPFYVHFPAALRSKEGKHVWFEQLVAEVRDIHGQWSKPHGGVRNEVLDLMVGTGILAELHGVTRLNWASPPAWAAPWDTNSMVVASPLPIGSARPTELTPPAPVPASRPAATPAPSAKPASRLYA